jgi:biotin carboxyl carrier protein
MYKATVNESHTVLLDKEAKTIDPNSLLNTVEHATDCSFSAVVNGESLTAFITDIDEDSNIISVKIRHNTYDVHIETPADDLVNKLGIIVAKPQKAKALESPMPGLILKVLVAPGDQVSKGENLLVLEAMKMENVFKASSDGIVKEIPVQASQAVEKGQTLIIFE